MQLFVFIGNAVVWVTQDLTFVPTGLSAQWSILSPTYYNGRNDIDGIHQLCINQLSLHDRNYQDLHHLAERYTNWWSSILLDSISMNSIVEACVVRVKFEGRLIARSRGVVE
ncbi:hypothetical protein M407DRAFT_10860 [Tulasnella calospora MUT 4182]|uniref:Uncharacterized protein n=1 Tax=Tulasnella calospora MUT 4182 TaxID=1051891 RepID=A0A0C3LG95_9AGAM|nr:hypothetical protein M407DRAFT_10860 [Tulasnella calospora MUT 4182]